MSSPPILTPDQRLRVFVSSTLTELSAERAAVRDAINALRLVPVMFETGARPHPPREVYRAYLDQSQVFVGVYGESYGWQPPDAPISGLEDEYRLAGGGRLPLLSYVRRAAPERDPRLATMIDDMRSRSDVSCREFTDPAQLRRQVEQDLAALLTERFTGGGGTPPLDELPAVPAPRGPLIGREAEFATLVELLTDGRAPLVTLTGPGGVGKTRLANELATRLRDRFADGVGYVDLSTVTRPERVGEMLARSLGLRTSGEGTPVDELVVFLRPKSLLLVVDNFEQVAEAAPVVGRLLRAAPGVTALVTSRAPLRIDGERAYAVPPLSVPAVGTDRVATAEHGAVRLFVARATAANRDFRLTPDNLGTVVEICRRLDGLPLAIELAAARARVLPLAEILDRLDQPLELLTSGARDLPARQRTLRGTIAWSYQLLDLAERRLLGRLSVFAGGFDTIAAEAVGGTETLDVLLGLVDSSLLGQSPGTYRYEMLGSIREYARERLAESDDEQAAHRAHADYFHDLALEAGPQLTSRAAAEWIRRLAGEHDNVITALYWYLKNGEPEVGLRMAAAIWVYWWLHGPLEQARRFTDRIDAVRGRLPAAEQGGALLAAGAVMLVTGDVAGGRERLVEARPLLLAAGDDEGFLNASGTLAQAAIRDRDFATARALEAEAREITKRVGSQLQVSLGLNRLGVIALAEGDHDRADDLLTSALEVAVAGDVQLARIVVLYSLAVNAILRDDLPGAERHLRDGLAAAHDIGDVNSSRLFVAAIADVAARRGDAERAARLAAGSGAMAGSSHSNWLDTYVPAWPEYVPVDLERYARVRREGKALGLAAVVTEALRPS